MTSSFGVMKACISYGVFSIVAAAFSLGLVGCSVLDPDGDWRGRPLHHPQVALAAAVHVTAPAAAPVVLSPVALPPSSGGSASPKAMVSSEADLDALIEAVERTYANGRFDEAQRLVDQVLSERPDEPRAWFRQGNLSHRRGDHDKAARAYRRVVALVNDSSASIRTDLFSLRARANANLAILAVEQAKEALDSLGSVANDPAAAAHRARIETALQTVVTMGAASSISSPPPSVPAFAPQVAVEVGRSAGEPSTRLAPGASQIELIRGAAR